MKYLMLVYHDEIADMQLGQEEQNAIMQDYFGFIAEAQQRGALRGVEILMPTASATTVRVREGKALTTDGPFAETKEQLGGFFILECKDLDEAIELAAKIPGAKNGSIEIRPVVEMGGESE